MAFDENVAERVRAEISRHENVVEKRMFGGLAFMQDGHMCCGVLDTALMARVGPDQYEAALKLPHVREMDFTGRPLKGFVYVDSKGFDSPKRLREWIERCRSFVATLPPK